MSPQNPLLVDRGRRMRSEPTDAEEALWSRLRGRRLCGKKFRRQHPIGEAIVDFCCEEARLVLEVDGGQHAEQAGMDAVRSEVLGRQGYRVLRFWNHEVLAQMDSVLLRIVEVLGGSGG